MPRPRRADEAGGLDHALNRGHGRLQIFWKDDDYLAFERILAEGLDEYDVSVYSFQLMPNHWHLVLRPNVDGEMSRFLRWVTATHTMRYHAHDHTSGEGHVSQGRFKSFPIQDDEHFLTVCRYVERNALRAEFVPRAEEWRWGSLWRWIQDPEPKPALLSSWLGRTGQSAADGERTGRGSRLGQTRMSIRRSRMGGIDRQTISDPFELVGLQSTLRPRGRPRVRNPPSIIENES